MQDTLYIFQATNSRLHALALDRAGATIPKRRHDDDHEALSWKFMGEISSSDLSAFTTRQDVIGAIERQGYCYVAPSELVSRFT